MSCCPRLWTWPGTGVLLPFGVAFKPFDTVCQCFSARLQAGAAFGSLLCLAPSMAPLGVRSEAIWAVKSEDIVQSVSSVDLMAATLAVPALSTDRPSSQRRGLRLASRDASKAGSRRYRDGRIPGGQSVRVCQVHSRGRRLRGDRHSPVAHLRRAFRQQAAAA